MRVGIVDNQALVRSGVASILEAGNGLDIDIVGEAEDGQAAIYLAESTPMDVMLIDVDLAGVDGLAATKAILADTSDPPSICMLTTVDTEQLVYDALLAGARGILHKNTSPEDLRAAVTIIASGGAVFSPAALTALVGACESRRPNLGPSTELDALTPRETEIFEFVATGCNNTEIAAALHVSESTVKTHFGRILAKLGLRDRVQVVLYAVRQDLVRSGQARPIQ